MMMRRDLAHTDPSSTAGMGENNKAQTVASQ
jgi:hypothetical protein